MNIIFIDNCKLDKNFKHKNKFNLVFNNFGFCYFREKNIFYLNIDEKKINNKLNSNFFIYFLKFKIKGTQNFIVMSRYIKNNTYIMKLLNTYLCRPIFVSEQNNLYTNDKIYIEDYLKKYKINLKDVKVLFVIDELNEKEKEKFEEMLGKYKIVDIFMLKPSSSVRNYVNKINNKLGTVVEILDKIPNEYYNILLVFSRTYKYLQNKSSFILDYNNSDLDIKSNIYLIFKENKKQYEKIFNILGMDMSRFEKTKLGKLYVHASELILDI